MNASASSLTKADWEALLEPVLSASLREASDRITQTPAVQKWLHAASFEAAEGLGQMDPMQAESEGYWRMMEGLADRFPELMAAVDELSEGCVTVDLHWRPLDPSFTRIDLRTTDDHDSNVLLRLDAATEAAIRDALQTLAAALPEGDPFPNRPHEATGAVAFDGQCLTVRLREHTADEGTRRSVLLLHGASSSDPFSVGQAVRAIRAFFLSDRGDA